MHKRVFWRVKVDGVFSVNKGGLARGRRGRRCREGGMKRGKQG